ncbi:MAG: GntR family transcriptional regulator [Deltaproteobacteria bacterium]|nr:GntR family transcriptional regulator [Deltaproteobacteria bacterium]
MNIDGVTGSAAKYLRRKILTGEFRPGERLNEVALSSMLEISRAPLREAFRILERDRLVVSVPRKGCYVAELSIADFIELFQTREMIECYAIDLLGQKEVRTIPHLESLLSSTSAQPPQGSIDPQERLDYLEAVTSFHRLLVEASGNKRILALYEAIVSNVTRYQFIYFFRAEHKTDSREEHMAILDRLGKGEYQEAKALLRGHIRRFESLMRSLMHQA